MKAYLAFILNLECISKEGEDFSLSPFGIPSINQIRTELPLDSLD